MVVLTNNTRISARYAPFILAPAEGMWLSATYGALWAPWVAFDPLMQAELVGGEYCDGGEGKGGKCGRIN